MQINLKAVALLMGAALLVVAAFSMASAGKDSGRPWIGVFTQSIDEDLKEVFNLDRLEGALVIDVVDDSPADEAGLRRKDIIISFSGKEVKDPDDLIDLVAEHKAGDKVNIAYLRKGKEKTATVEVAQRPKARWSRKDFKVDRTWPRQRRIIISEKSDPFIGVGIENLNNQLGEYFGVKDGDGVLITEVFEDSPAEKAGLKAGDVIVAFDGEQVVRTLDLIDIIDDHEEGDTVEVEFIRRGEKQSLRVEIEEDFSSAGSFSIPDFNIPKVPDIKWYGHESWDDDDLFYRFDVDREEYDDLMEDLREEMNEIRKELEKLKAKLE